jgi:hypothetical protein
MFHKPAVSRRYTPNRVAKQASAIRNLPKFCVSQPNCLVSPPITLSPPLLGQASDATSPPLQRIQTHIGGDTA